MDKKSILLKEFLMNELEDRGDNTWFDGLGMEQNMTYGCHGANF
jgi:hypothetical protein